MNSTWTYLRPEQNGASKTRKELGLNDTRAILNFLENRNPFSNDSTLQSIATGLPAADPDSVIVGSAKAVGVQVLLSMVDTNALEYSFKLKNQAVIMLTSVVIIGNENHQYKAPSSLSEALSCELQM